MSSSGLSRPQKEISCKYFYDDAGSALFDEICELDEYYLTRTELAILEVHAAEMADAIGEDCELIEFGSGSGLKTRLLLEQLRAPRAYLPVDIAREPLERSALDLAERFPNLRDSARARRFHRAACYSRRPVIRGRVASSIFPARRSAISARGGDRSCCRTIAWLVGEGGGLLIGFDLDKDESIVWPAYNDRRGVSAAFNLNLLERINRELGADFDVCSVYPSGRLRSLEGTHGDVPGQPRNRRSFGSRGWSFHSSRVKRSIRNTLTNTLSNISAG